GTPGARRASGHRSRSSCTSDGASRLEHQTHDVRVARPTRELGREVFSAGGGDAIELRLAVSLRDAPLRVEPTLVFHAVERRIERTLCDLQLLARDLLDRAHDGESVHWTPGQCLEDQQVERAADEVELHWTFPESREPKNLRYKILRL